MGYAASRYEETGTVEPWVAKMNDETQAALRAQLGDELLTERMAEGATLTAATAVDVATVEMQAASVGLVES